MGAGWVSPDGVLCLELRTNQLLHTLTSVVAAHYFRRGGDMGLFLPAELFVYLQTMSALSLGPLLCVAILHFWFPFLAIPGWVASISRLLKCAGELVFQMVVLVPPNRRVDLRRFSACGYRMYFV